MATGVFLPGSGEALGVDVEGSTVQRSTSDKATHALLCDLVAEAKKIRIMLEHITGFDLEGMDL